MTTIYHWKQSKKNNIHSGPNQHELGVLTSLCDFVPVGGKPPRFCGSTFRWARHAGHVCDTPIDFMRWSAVPLPPDRLPDDFFWRIHTEAQVPTSAMVQAALPGQLPRPDIPEPSSPQSNRRC